MFLIFGEDCLSCKPQASQNTASLRRMREWQPGQVLIGFCAIGKGFPTPLTFTGWSSTDAAKSSRLGTSRQFPFISLNQFSDIFFAYHITAERGSATRPDR